MEKLRRLVLGRIPTTPEFATGTSIWLAYEAKSIDDPVIAELVQSVRSILRKGILALNM